ncbi:MAG: glycosyltransferase [Desulfomicrobium sp.]|nr:glycosyltransferase [Pseudomonadota bacterium]MBV1713184.1 glycosyltransferase [Desulfomicrobium sp.]MBU4571288.1 glycosyltransferase [Pseudomonadota bacterium]MBU4595550.1 glycosyltransferase [Pseudomonadota bacterium]MBV1719992.1 glycosyltransferase [Desulfomicrobium sp.]
MLTLVTYTYNDHDFARAQLDRLGSFGNLVQAVIVVDDGSEEAFIPPPVPGFPGGVTVLRHPTNLGPAAAKRTGLGHADTEFIFSIDSDIVCDRIWLPSALSVMAEHPNVALVGAQPLASDLGDILSRALHLRSRYQSVPARPLFASGEIWLMRKKIYTKVNGLEGYEQRTHEDWHLCRKITQAGHDIVLHQTGTVRQTRKIRRAAQVRRDAVYYFKSYRSILESRGPEAILRVFTDELLHAVRLADTHDAHILVYIELAKILLVLAELHQGDGHDAIFAEVIHSFSSVFGRYPSIMSAVEQDLPPQSLTATSKPGPAIHAELFTYLFNIIGTDRLERIDTVTLPRSFSEESESQFDFHYLQ